ncbi:MAG: EamA family transporter [Actinomycetes bacterium]
MDGRINPRDTGVEHYDTIRKFNESLVMTLATLHPAAVAKTASRTPATARVMLAIALAQLGGAAAIGLFGYFGPLGAAWLRLVWGAVLLVAIVRPNLRHLPRTDLRAAAGLGVVNGLMMLAFFEALARLPLGTAVALSFMGPLAVAVAKTRSRLGLIWPMIGLVGVLVLTTPWAGHINWVGVGFALLDGVLWGTYILLTQHVANRFDGAEGLVVSMVVAALVATPFGIGAALPHLTISLLLAAGGVALLTPVAAFWLEMGALRDLPPETFGTLMCLEPAVGLLVGFLFLHQVPTAMQGLGVVLVIAAAYGAERHRRFIDVRYGASGLA